MSAIEGREKYSIPKIMFWFYATGGCFLGEQLVIDSGRRKMRYNLRHSSRAYGNIK